MTKQQIPNTIVTIGDIHYLWGLFLLIASVRKAGMKEPFLVGVQGFSQEAGHILTQLGDVELLSLDDARHSLTCLKAYAMLQAKSEFVTWADSDAFFTGDVSSILLPEKKDEIHFRLREPSEMPAAFRGHAFGEDGRSIPAEVLAHWQRDVAAVAATEVRKEPRYQTTGSASFFSLSLARHRAFLEQWHALQMKVLPARNIGVVDASLRYYHQLDESTLNACLNFLPDAPAVQNIYRMDKDPQRLFVHFIAQPKPWQGWTRRAFQHFDAYTAIPQWAIEQGYELPGPLPASLQQSNKRRLQWLIPWMTLKPKLQKRLRRLFP